MQRTHGEYGDIHKEIVLNPAIFSLIGMIENKEVLDARLWRRLFKPPFS